MKYILKIILLMVVLNTSFQVGAQESFQSKRSMGKMEKVQSVLDSATISVHSNPSKSFDYVEQALSLSIRSGDKNSEAQSYQILGKINYTLEQPDLSITYYQKAIVLFGSINDEKQLNDTYLLMGDAYAKLKDEANANIYYSRYLDYVEKKGDENKVLLVKNKIADLQLKTGKLKKAASMYNEIMKKEEMLGNNSGVLDAQNKIGQIYFETDRKDMALNTYKKLEERAKNTNDTPSLSNSLRQQSNIFRTTKQYYKELGTRKELLDIEKKKNNQNAVAEENLQIGNIYIEQNQADKAIPYINQSIKITENTGNLEQKSNALKSLSTAYSKNDQYSKALEVYRKYAETADNMYKQREAEIKSGIQLLTTLNRKLQRLDLIEKELTISDRTVELLKQEQIVNQKGLKARNIFNISLATAFLVLAIAFLLIYRSSIQKRKANQMLALKSLRSQMNPHFIYNSLNSVNNFISRNDEKSANKYLSDFSRLMRAVMDNSKHDFVPLSSELEILDLYLKLEHTRFNDKFDYSFEVEPGLDVENCQVPPMLIQPFIENSIWHGLRYREDKGFLNVQISQDNDDVVIIIEDNGIGRKKSEEVKTKFQKEHVSTGLRNIENRINIINDYYKVNLDVKVEDLDKESESGTRVKVVIPLRK